MFIRSILLATIGIHFLATSLLAQATYPTMSVVDDRMQGFVDKSDLAGAVTLVSVDGKIVHLGTAGWSDLEAKVPMKPTTIFSMASMTKPMTAVGVLILVDEGKLALDEPVSKHLPEFNTDKLRDITLRQLITHTSGLVGNQQNEGSLAATATMMAGRPVGFAAGSKWAYSPGMTIAGRLIEVASGMPYEEFLAKKIFEPLGMVDTSFVVPKEKEDRIAKIYKRSTDGKSLTVNENWFLGSAEGRTPNPSGGIFSTAPDMYRFLLMLQQGGELAGVRILRADTVKEMTRIQTGDLKAGFVPGSAWGLGVGIVKEPQGVTAMLAPGTFGHGGLWGTQGWVDPKHKVIYLLLIQRAGIPNSDASKYRLAFQESAAKELGVVTTPSSSRP